jgi:tetratricopeptide (TPR) repeat protein
MQHRYAIALRKAGRLDEAQDRYSEIIRREPRWAAPKLELGALFEERGELDKALESYQEGLRLDPKHAPGHASVGRVKLQMGRFEEARAAFERAKALGSDSAALDALLATAAQLLGRDADAIRENRSALARDPELIWAANNLAWVLATSRDPALREPAEAVRLAELAVEKQTPPDPGYLDTLATSYAADGRFDDAVRTATSALDLAKERGDGATEKEIRARLDLFRAHRAWVEPARE